MVPFYRFGMYILCAVHEEGQQEAEESESQGLSLPGCMESCETGYDSLLVAAGG